MRYKWLKRLRVITALIFFSLITLVFLDFRNIFHEAAIVKILWLQFTPSLLKFITLLSLSSAGFILVLLLTILSGRTYCSVICPLGIFQDFITRAGKLFKVRKRFKYRKPHFKLRNFILILVIISLFTGSLLLVNILDPYSLYGKIANGVFRPIGIWLNNIVTAILEKRGVYYLYHIDLLPFKALTLVLPFLIILTLFIMAGKHGRLFCNTICPVGTILGWVSKYSLLDCL